MPMDFWDFFWLLIWTYVLVMFLMVLFQIITDLFRDPELGGGGQGAVDDRVDRGALRVVP
jgi:hypothetical protein